MSVQDITVIFERIFSRSIITIAFGEDISDDKFELKMCKERKSKEFVTKMVSIREAGSEMIDQCMEAWIDKTANPINFLWRDFGRIFSTSEYHRTVTANCKALRAHILAYVEDRRSGKRKSALEGSVDLLSMFFANADIFTDEFIVDELLDFFIAGSITTQYATQTVIAHFIKNKDDLKKIRDEFDKAKMEALKEDPSLADLDKEAFLEKFVTLERVQDLEFLNMVNMETLRFCTPA
jgi:cytochrome P450